MNIMSSAIFMMIINWRLGLIVLMIGSVVIILSQALTRWLAPAPGDRGG